MKIIAKNNFDDPRNTGGLKTIAVMQPQLIDKKDKDDKPDYIYMEVYEDDTVVFQHYPTAAEALQAFADNLNPEAWLPF